MNELESSSGLDRIDEPGDRLDAAGYSAAGRWQVGLRTVVLITAGIAVWTTVYVNRKKNADLAVRIAVARPLAHELSVDDPSRIAVVMLEQEWYDDNRWDVYLPAGNYRLCVATREIDDNGLAPVVKSVPLSAGRCRIGLDQREVKSAWHVILSLDDKPALEIEEPKEWYTSGGSSGGSEFSTGAQLDSKKPVVLFRRRFMRATGKIGGMSSPTVPSEGVLLWIERVSSTDVGSRSR